MAFVVEVDSLQRLSGPLLKDVKQITVFAVVGLRSRASSNGSVAYKDMPFEFLRERICACDLGG